MATKNGIKKATGIFSLISTMLSVVLGLLIIYLVVCFSGIWESEYCLIDSYNKPDNGEYGDLPEDAFEFEEKPCEDYHLYTEFVKAFGSDLIDSARLNCLVIGGTYYTEDDIIGCLYDSEVYSFNCDHPGTLNAKKLCLGMNADWVCGPTNDFMGCICDRTTPAFVSATTTTLSQDPVYTCGWTPHIAGDICEGTCPDGKECVVLPNTDNCDCWTQDEIAAADISKYMIFVTGSQWNGAMGGILGADEKCQVAAYYAGLGTNWISLISDDSSNIIDRMSDGKFVRVDGVLIADSKADLFDGTIANPINVDEHGDLVSGDVWTGTSIYGVATPNNCNNWGWVDSIGSLGLSTYTSGWWVGSGSGQCVAGAHLYCVQV